MSDYQPTPPPATPYGSTPPTKTPILSILSLIFGILGILGSLFLFGSGFLPGLAGVILGFLGRRREPHASRGLWLTGIITGFVAIAIAIIVIIGIAVIAAIGASNPSS